MTHSRFSPAARTLGAALLLSTLSLPAQAQNSPINVIVDGRPVDFGGSPPTQVGGRTLVPLRAIFEALGAQVEFASGTIRARRGDTNLQLAIGSSQAIINGQVRTLDVPAQAVFGRTLVPLRFVGEALGAGVNFNAATQTITIVSPGAGSTSGFPTLPTMGNTPTPPAYTVPETGQSVSGTLVDTPQPGTVTISVGGGLRTYAVNNNALILRQISLAASPSATPMRQAARQITLAGLTAGDPVRLSLDNANRVTQITTTATVITARVQFAGGNQIVLDDERDTTLTLGPNLRFIDAAGRVSNTVSNLAPGQSVGLFLSREGRTVYQVSAYAPDFTPQSGNTVSDPFPANNTPPASGAPQIQLVAHNAATPLRAGTRLEVTARATPGLRASFSLGSRIQNVPLSEDPARPGVYLGSYIVRSGDDVLNGRVAVRAVGANNVEDFAQSTENATIDTIAPRLVGTFPANGAQIGVAQPNIAIFADDLGGSGLGGAQVDLLTGSDGNPDVTRIPATVAPTSVNAVAPAALSGPVRVRAVITDKAGNPLNVNFSFSAAVNTGAITSFSHGANRALQPGDDIPLVLAAQPAGRASFDVYDERNQIIAREVPLTEVKPGRYRASYRVPNTTTGNVRFVGRFTATDGTSSQLEATTRVQVVGDAVPLTVQSPREGERVTSPLVVRGQASPNATVDVALRAEGTQFFILEYRQDLGTKQVRADAAGNWTASIDLPTLRNVSGLRYIISATQADATGRAGEPVVVTVTR